MTISMAPLDIHPDDSGYDYPTTGVTVLVV